MTKKMLRQRQRLWIVWITITLKKLIVTVRALHKFHNNPECFKTIALLAEINHITRGIYSSPDLCRARDGQHSSRSKTKAHRSRSRTLSHLKIRP